MEPESAPSSVTVDEDGDLILLVGAEAQTRILVSSKVLIISSKVFKAMLSKSFKEARELAESANKNGPYELPLPDDDIHAMVALCRIVHHRSRDIPNKGVTMSLLKSVASHAYKYDCVEAVSYVTLAGWVTRFEKDPNEIANLLLVAYLLDNAEVFGRVTRQMVLSSTDDFEDIMEDVDVDHQLPEVLFDQLRKQRRVAYDAIAIAIDERLDDMNEGQISLNEEHGQDFRRNQFASFSQHDAERSNMFMHYMRKDVFWPFEMRAKSLDDTLTSLRLIKNDSIGGSSGKNSFGRACQTTIPKQVKLVIDAAEASINGVCLDCVKHVGGSAGICRVQHEKEA